jgi:NADH:ubiquinone oxidoreductase subunit 6 (subunit J)
MQKAIFIFIIAEAIAGAILAIRAKRLLISALWLATVSSMLAIIFYLLGAQLVAVLELSVGAGLVTVLFVFAISISGDEAASGKPFVPSPLAIGLVVASYIIIGVILFSQNLDIIPQVSNNISNVIWKDRSLDIVAQIVLIFAGTLGLLGLLAEDKAPLTASEENTMIARREEDLDEMRPDYEIEEEN